MTSASIQIALVGTGKIARDQHVPALRGNPDFRLLAGVDPDHGLEGLPGFPDVAGLLHALPAVTAVAVCTTPQARFELARLALQHGRDVLLEKPPGVTLGEVRTLVRLADQRHAVVFAAWHSRFAPGVSVARNWLAQRRIREIHVFWQEDVRIWHPGQAWIWQPGGMGVFDPGINALSILTHILPEPIVVRAAELSYPENCGTPIAAQLRLTHGSDSPIFMELDFRHTGEPRWDIEFDTDAGRLTLSRGARHLALDGQRLDCAGEDEYPALYKHFATLVRARRSDVDLAPLRLVADALLCGRRTEVEPFVD
jgi:predicted dehydrogenase